MIRAMFELMLNLTLYAVLVAVSGVFLFLAAYVSVVVALSAYAILVAR